MVRFSDLPGVVRLENVVVVMVKLVKIKLCTLKLMKERFSSGVTEG